MGTVSKDMQFFRIVFKFFQNLFLYVIVLIITIAKQMMEWQHSEKNIKELFNSMSLRFEGNKVFVFTPKNQLIELDEGSTPIDFAYAVHSDLGSKCERAKVNGKIVPLSHILKNGDIVEITINKNKNPSKDWLRFVKTSFAHRLRNSE